MTATTAHQQVAAQLIDVDQATGRLLSVNELRRALQLARSGADDAGPTNAATSSSPAQLATAAPAQPPAPRADHAHYEPGVSDRAAGSRLADGTAAGLLGPLAPPARRFRSTADRDEISADAEDWLAGFDLDPTDVDPPEEHAPHTQRTHPEPGGGRRRGRCVAVGRRVLGLDRPANKPQLGRPAKGGRGDVAWLAGVDEPSAQTIDDTARKPHADRKSFAQSATPTGVPQRATRGVSEQADGLEISAAPRGVAAGLWLWVARLAVAVVFLAGVNQVFIKPFRTVKPVAAAVTMDVAASQQAAARYVSDYLRFLPGRGPAQLAALQGDVVESSGAGVVQWSGTGYLRVDSVLPGQVLPIDATHSLVSVAALIRSAMPPQRQNADTTARQPGTTGGDPGPVPAGWRDLGSRWIQLSVPVQMTGPGVRVSGAGAVFAGETPHQVAEPAGAQDDQRISAATAGVGRSLLAAYASSDLSYLAAPGVSLNGLHGAVTLVSVTGWSVALPPDGGNGGSGGTGTVTVTVTWQLVGTDLHISQPYAIALTNSQGRWYGAALSPNPAAQ